MAVPAIKKTVLAVVLGLMIGARPEVRALAADAKISNPLFAYCIGLGVPGDFASVPAQKQMAPMLAELGYAGMACVGTGGALELREALEKHGQKLVAVYIDVNVDPGNRGYDPAIKDLLPKLAGHGTVVWAVVNSGKYKPSSTDGDARAVELLQPLADAAQAHGIQLSLYPHFGCYAQRVEDVVRLARKIQRKNVGVSFTFCHFLALDDIKNMDRVLQLAKPYLNMVTINGSDGYGRPGWIRTLDEGTFDLSKVLIALHKVDYRGPIGFIGYGIRGDRHDVLARSAKGWQAIVAKAAATSP